MLNESTPSTKAKIVLDSNIYIAAYTELVGADYLVTQNRRFLKSVEGLPFTIIDAAQAIQLLSSKEED